MRQTLTFCDTCGEDVGRVSPRYVRVTMEGALRNKDKPGYELCEPCWEHALESAITWVKQRTEAMADLIAQRQRQRQLPVDQPRADAAMRQGPTLEWCGAECTTCGETYDVNSVEFTRLYSMLKLPDTLPGDRVFLNPTPPCGHQQPDLQVTVDENDHVTNVRRIPTDEEAS